MPQQEALFGSRILIVDDEEANVLLLQRILARAGYTNLTVSQDSRQFFDLLESVQPDLVLLDLLMPNIDGYEILERMANRLEEQTYLPVMVLTADVTPRALERALSLGAKDFLTKPLDRTELLLRVGNLLQTRHLYLGLQRQMERLEGLNLDSQQAILVRDESLSTISHDIGQPLAAMRFTTELLQDIAKDLDPQAQAVIIENLSRIESASTQMASMISELSDLARLQMGRELTLHRQQVDLVRLAKEQVGLYAKTPHGKRLKLVSSTGSLVGNWDEARLARVVSNLLSNAIKFSPKGGEIVLSVEQEEDNAVLSVRDHGMGIPPEDLKHVFDPFYRASNVFGKIDGSGVGLASAKQIVEQHSGKITVESEAGQGTTFILRLPLS